MIQGAERRVEGISINRKLLPMLVCAVPVCTVLCGCVAKPQTEQDKAVAEIKKLGGNVTLDEKGPDAAVIGVILVGTKVTDAKLEHLKGLTQLQQLYVGSTQVTDAGIDDLKKALLNCNITPWTRKAK
jgi:hypothetical protein